MDLLEYQGKQLFAKYGIPVSDGKAVTDIDSAVATANEVGYPVVLKAQVLVGGRGKTVTAGPTLSRMLFDRAKLDAIGYGFFIPIFFITVGAKFDLAAAFRVLLPARNTAGRGSG